MIDENTDTASPVEDPLADFRRMLSALRRLHDLEDCPDVIPTSEVFQELRRSVTNLECDRYDAAALGWQHGVQATLDWVVAEAGKGLGESATFRAFTGAVSLKRG